MYTLSAQWFTSNNAKKGPCPSPNVSPPTMADRTGYTATTITSSTTSTTTREEDGSRDMVDVAEEAT
ncbi:unnamed protein product [Merluccius merluccius]